MSLTVGRGMLIDARREFLARWQRLRETWDDANARAFEARFVTPVDRLVRTATDAMDELAATAERARRECE